MHLSPSLPRDLGTLEAERSGGAGIWKLCLVTVVFPQDADSCPAVASHVLLLTAPCSACNIEQAAQVLLTRAELPSSDPGKGDFSSASIHSVFKFPQHQLQCLLHLQIKSISQTSPSLPTLKSGSAGEDDSGEREPGQAGSFQQWSRSPTNPQQLCILPQAARSWPVQDSVPSPSSTACFISPWSHRKRWHYSPSSTCQTTFAHHTKLFFTAFLCYCCCRAT